MKIKVLPERVINQIAAGEVVERPFSVVKELIENSADSGAKNVSVRITNGGLSLIEVSDDGSGMERDDAILAFERHATSKISKASDLENIYSHGFRGEALSSIASVSKITLKTVTKDSSSGSEISIIAGQLKSVNDIAFQNGTLISVKNLFFNTPARKKFLKSAQTEKKKITQFLKSFSLAYPEISIKLFSDNTEVINLPSRKNHIDRAKTFYKSGFIEYSHKNPKEELSFIGLIGHPALAYTKKSGFTILVNKRVVQNSTILKAVREGFGSTLKEREFPIGFIALQIDGKKIDVNVHPQKTEVKFRDPKEIYSNIRESINIAFHDFKSEVRLPEQLKKKTSINSDTEGLRQKNQATVIDFSSKQTKIILESKSEKSEEKHFHTKEQDIKEELDLNQLREMSLKSTVNVENGLRLATPKQISAIEIKQDDEEITFSNLNYLGTIFKCFLLCEYDERFYVVDMHAAHERYNYNKIRNSFKKATLQTQMLTIPETVNLGIEETDSIKSSMEVLKNFGFDLEIFGEDSILVRGVPTLLGKLNLKSLFSELSKNEFDLQTKDFLKKEVDHVSARLACHASVRSGDLISKKEVNKLFSDLDSTEFKTACPHGRPVIKSFSKKNVEDWFGRD